MNNNPTIIDFYEEENEIVIDVQFGEREARVQIDKGDYLLWVRSEGYLDCEEINLGMWNEPFATPRTLEAAYYFDYSPELCIKEQLLEHISKNPLTCNGVPHNHLPDCIRWHLSERTVYLPIQKIA